MNISINVRLDLSPAFTSALHELCRAVVGRETSPLRPYQDAKPDWLNALQQEMAVDRPAPTPTPREPVVQVDPGKDVEVSTSSQANVSAEAETEQLAPASEPEVRRWTEERIALLDFYYPAGDALSEILPRLNASPGPVVSYDQMRAQIVYRKLKRSDKPAEPVVKASSGGEQHADDATIRHWAASRGLCNGGMALDLGLVNAKRRHLGLPVFVRSNGLAQSAATLRVGAVG